MLYFHSSSYQSSWSLPHRVIDFVCPSIFGARAYEKHTPGRSRGRFGGGLGKGEKEFRDQDGPRSLCRHAGPWEGACRTPGGLVGWGVPWREAQAATATCTALFDRFAHFHRRYSLVITSARQAWDVDRTPFSSWPRAAPRPRQPRHHAAAVASSPPCLWCWRRDFIPLLISPS